MLLFPYGAVIAFVAEKKPCPAFVTTQQTPERAEIDFVVTAAFLIEPGVITRPLPETANLT
ncbi:hypothetical protein ABW48_14370 [Pluralibacter gergoviae]|nr:hypothetical protein ABW48_14370 [Pluralibacter gergoviae]